MERVHVFISGRVQGVFFRAFVNRKATGLGLKGWVKNTEDSRVEAVFEGKEEKVKEMLELCNRGPAGSKVEGVEYNEEPIKNETKFQIFY